MAEYSNKENKDRIAERFQTALTRCHNILRSQEGLSSERAFSELNKLLYVKLYGESTLNNRYTENTIEQTFEEVKRRYQYEHLFSESVAINVSRASCMDVLGTLNGINLNDTMPDVGRGYEDFVQKVLRGYNEATVIAKNVVEFVSHILHAETGSHIIDPNCGYGGLLSGMLARPLYGNERRLWGYDRDPLMVQTAKLNLILHGDKEGRIERSGDSYGIYQKKFELLVSCMKSSQNVDEDIRHAMSLLKHDGKAALIVSDEILQKEQYYHTRREMMVRATVAAIISLPAGAVRIGNRQQKTSIVVLLYGRPHNIQSETLLAQAENIGVSSLGLPSEKNDLKEIEPLVGQWLKGGAYTESEKIIHERVLDLDSWNVGAEFVKRENSYLTRYPMRRLSEIVEISYGRDDELTADEYKRVTVRKNQHDVVLRDVIHTKDIKNKSRQMVIHKGQILISQIDAKSGAIGIVPAYLDGAIVSDNYIAMDVTNRDVDKYYLLMVLTSERYQKLLKGISRGITPRSYIKKSELLEVEIPVPDMQIQQDLIGNLEKKRENINKLEKEWTEGVHRFSEKLFGI